MENHANLNLEVNLSNESAPAENNIEEEHTPQLFSEEQSNENEDSSNLEDSRENNSDELLDQDINEDEDFEIPAFLRRQKF